MKPILFYDGDCNFCRRWVHRWQSLTGGKVEYQSSLTLRGAFPHIPRDRLKTSVIYQSPDNQLSYGAEAVFRVLAHASHRGGYLWLYQHFPPFRWMTEFFYRLIARNRILFSSLTRWLWGTNLTPSEFAFSSWLFLRILGVIYFIAFASFWIQMPGLIGSSGLLPVSFFLEQIHTRLGDAAYRILPTLAWFNSSDIFLHLICAFGIIFSVFLVLGRMSFISLSGLWVLYLSIVTIGQEFMSFQWDILLLEAGFLALFLAPLDWHHPKRADSQPPRLIIALFHWLLFRLMFRSGWVKLASGDYAWKNLQALNAHYETQPLPTWIGWYAHQLPEWFQEFSVISVFAIELFVPFLIFGPRRIREWTAFIFIGFQLLIAATGNYCFFNLLTIALCLLLMDDETGLMKRLGASQKLPAIAKGGTRVRFLPRSMTAVVFAFIFSISAVLLARDFNFGWKENSVVNSVLSAVRPLRIINSYGLFAVMTMKRSEIIVEASRDGLNWRAYEFWWKPGDETRRPGFVAPHQPRLDWQMWFAALGNIQQNPWLVRMMTKFLMNDQTVLKLIKKNPFEGDPPRYIRAVLYDYQFTDIAERRANGRWWTGHRIRSYSPTLVRNGDKIEYAG